MRSVAGSTKCLNNFTAAARMSLHWVAGFRPISSHFLQNSPIYRRSRVLHTAVVSGECVPDSVTKADERLLSVLDVARRLSVSEGTVRCLISTGELEAYRVKHQWRVSPASFAEYLARNASRRPAATQVGGAA
jgi:excisionase family DNA binding protein